MVLARVPSVLANLPEVFDVPIKVKKSKANFKKTKIIKSGTKVTLKIQKSKIDDTETNEYKSKVKKNSSKKTDLKRKTVLKKTSRPPCKPLKADIHPSMKDNFTSPGDKTQVYVLELEGGFCYVGSSENVVNRIQQHLNGSGSKFTKTHKPTGKLIQRLSTLNGAGDSAERQETLLQMRKRGITKVRGWKYVSEKLSKSQIKDIKENMIEMFSLCRICAGSGHFATQCPKRRRLIK